METTKCLLETLELKIRIEKNPLVHILIYFLHTHTFFQVVFQQGTTKLSVEKDKTSVVSDVGISFTDPRTQSTYFSTDFENHEFHLPKGVKVLSVKKASTERVRAQRFQPHSNTMLSCPKQPRRGDQNCVSLQITSNAASDLNIKGDGKAIIRGNEGVNIMGRTVEFKMGGGIELRAVGVPR